MPKKPVKPKPATKTGELRAAQRQRVLLKGVVVHTSAQLTLDCAINEISASGARIRLASADALGEPIYLIDLTNALGFRASIAWRKDAVVGLTFSERYDLRGEAAGSPTILRRLWVEQIRQSPSSERW